MVRGISKELDEKVREVLERSISADPGSFTFVSLGTDPLKHDAILYLRDVGVFEETSSGSFRLTAHGREHWDQLNAPRWYWFRQNWFPASVAGATIVAASVSAAANIVNLIV